MATKTSTASARQAAYRVRHLKEGSDCRLDMVVSATTAAALARMARHRGVSRRAVLEAAVAAAERLVLDGLADDSDYMKPVTG